MMIAGELWKHRTSNSSRLLHIEVASTTDPLWSPLAFFSDLEPGERSELGYYLGDFLFMLSHNTSWVLFPLFFSHYLSLCYVFFLAWLDPPPLNR